MEWMRKGPQGSNAAWERAQGTMWQQQAQWEQHWRQQQQSQQQYQQAAAASAQMELSPAQRLRNALLACGGVFTIAYLWMYLPSSRRSPVAPPGSPVSNSASQAALVGAAAVGVAATGAAAASESNDAPRSLVPPKRENEVSAYYKSRTSKSSVRVRGSDSYVSSTEKTKSRATEEGFGSSVTAVANIARGFRPSESRSDDEVETSGAQPTISPAAPGSTTESQVFKSSPPEQAVAAPSGSAAVAPMAAPPTLPAQPPAVQPVPSENAAAGPPRDTHGVAQ